jgi:hypothetical protein
LESFIDDNDLKKDDWKVNSLSQFYFDCENRNKAFKLDPQKVVNGKYSEEQMALVG